MEGRRALNLEYASALGAERGDGTGVCLLLVLRSE
jgi:hypothetical protein